MASALVTACAPARSLPPSPGARGNGATERPRPATNPDQDAPSARTPLTPRPTRLVTPEPTPSPTHVASDTAEQTAAGRLGRDFVALTTATGTVQFLHGWDGPRAPLIETMMAEFGARYPGVEIEAEPLDPAALHDRLVTAVASGAPPNAVMVRSDSAAYFAEQRALLPLDELMARDRVQPDWFAPQELAVRAWDGRIFGLPHVASGAEQLLFVNTSLLHRAGRDPAEPITTWQQIESLIEPARRAGILALDPTRCGGGVPALQVWTVANGGRWLDDTARRIAWADPAGLEAASWLQQIVETQRGISPGMPPVGANPSAPLTVQEWLAEKHICCINDAGWIYQLQQLAPQLQFAVHELPRNATNAASDGRAPTFGGWMLAIPREARDQPAAWEWLKFATVSRAADQLAMHQQLAPPLTTGPDGSAAPDTSRIWPVVMSSLQRSVPTPSLPISAQLDDIARGAQAETLAQLRRPQPTLETAARAAQQLLDTWHARRRRTS